MPLQGGVRKEGVRVGAGGTALVGVLCAHECQYLGCCVWLSALQEPRG